MAHEMDKLQRVLLLLSPAALTLVGEQVGDAELWHGLPKGALSYPEQIAAEAMFRAEVIERIATLLHERKETLLD